MPRCEPTISKLVRKTIIAIQSVDAQHLWPSAGPGKTEYIKRFVVAYQIYFTNNTVATLNLTECPNLSKIKLSLGNTYKHVMNSLQTVCFSPRLLEGFGPIHSCCYKFSKIYAFSDCSLLNLHLQHFLFSSLIFLFPYLQSPPPLLPPQ